MFIDCNFTYIENLKKIVRIVLFYTCRDKEMTAKDYVFLKDKNEEFSLMKGDVGFIEKENENEFIIFFLRIEKHLTITKNKVEKFDISETGDRFEFKVCDRCYRYLDTEEHFENNRLKKDNVITKRPSCRSCRSKKNGISIPTKQKKEWEAKRPVNGSLFSCPICKKTTIVGISKIVLDHNHSTGNVRGWLCESCNTGIGRFDDKIEIIKHAIDWLEKTNH